MKLILEESDKALLRSILENLPEYSYSHLQCIAFDYKAMEFKFYEEEEDKEHTLTFDMAWEGFKKYLDRPHDQDTLGFLTDAGNWDASMVDTLVQLALLGEEVYG